MNRLRLVMRRGVDECGYRGEIRWRWERGFRTCCGGRLVGGGGVGLEISVLVVFHSSTLLPSRQLPTSQIL